MLSNLMPAALFVEDALPPGSSLHLLAAHWFVPKTRKEAC